MNRRAFLQRPAAPHPSRRPARNPQPLRQQAAALAAGRHHGQHPGPYTGAWGYAPAAHLLRRTLFGPTRAEINAAAASNLTAVLDGLLTAPAAPGPPLNVSATDPSVPIGQTWVTQPFDQTLQGARSVSLRDWWLGRLIP